MKNSRQFVSRVLLAIIAFSSSLHSQPFYYSFGSQDIKGNIKNIYRLNLSSGQKELFTTDSNRVQNLDWNHDQSWLYVATRYNFQLIETGTRRKHVLISNEEFRGTDGAVYDPQINKLFVSWLKAEGSEGATISQTYVFNPDNFELIDSEGVAIRPSSIVSRDGSRYFDYGPDSLGNYTIFSVSIESKTLIDERPFFEIGPQTTYKSYLGGKYGKCLLRYGQAFAEKRYCIVNLVSNAIETDFPFPWRSEAKLSPDGKHVIIEEVYFEKSATEPDEYRPGSVFVFEASTGKLIRRLFLPPEGKVLLFDNYPEKLFYLVENAPSITPISVDLTESTPSNALLDTLVSLKHRLYGLDQVGDPTFVKELDNGLENAKKHLAKGDSVNCAKELVVFQEKVKAEYERKATPGNKRFVSEEAYKQLYFNAQYIVDRLPKKR